MNILCQRFLQTIALLGYNYTMKKICIAVTTNCFMECDGCRFNIQTPKEIPLPKIIETSKNLYKEGYRKITITGGDPMYRKDLREIVDSLYDIGFRIHLDTSGIPLLEDFSLKGLEEKIYLIGIPLDGTTEKIIRKFRSTCPIGVKDIKEIIKLLSDNNFRISVNTVVHKDNIQDLQGIYNIISEYEGVKRWELHQFSPTMSTRRDILVGNKDFKTAVSKIKNPSGIEISPKSSKQKKLSKVILFKMVETVGFEPTSKS